LPCGFRKVSPYSRSSDVALEKFRVDLEKAFKDIPALKQNHLRVDIVRPSISV
jgi:hypothetical protein